MIVRAFQFPYLGTLLEIRLHVLVDEALEIDAETPIGADDDISADTVIRRYIAAWVV